MKKYTTMAILLAASAYPLFADEPTECCPSPQGAEVCCNGEIINPAVKQTVNVSLNFSGALQTAQQAASLVKFNGTGLKWCCTGNLMVSVSGEGHAECCDVSGGGKEKKNLDKFSANANVDLGKGTATWNITGTVVPSWIGGAYAEASLGFKIVISSISVESTCAGGEVCHGPISGQVTLGGEIGGQLANGYFRVAGGLEGSGNLGVKICLSPEGNLYLKDPGATVSGVKAYIRVKAGSITLDTWELDLMS